MVSTLERNGIIVRDVVVNIAFLTYIAFYRRYFLMNELVYKLAGKWEN